MPEAYLSTKAYVKLNKDSYFPSKRWKMHSLPHDTVDIPVMARSCDILSFHETGSFDFEEVTLHINNTFLRYHRDFALWMLVDEDVGELKLDTLIPLIEHKVAIALCSDDVDEAELYQNVLKRIYRG